MVVNWPEKGGKGMGGQYPYHMAEAHLQQWLFAPQPASIMADYCPDVKRDASKVASAHQATDI